MASFGSCTKLPGVTATSPVASTALGNVSDIGVVTLKADVRLIDELDNQTRFEEAIKNALASNDAHTIHHQHTIKK